MRPLDFDPNAPSTSDSGIFGLTYTEKESQLVLLPVPWEATVSYGEGTAKGPDAILEASRQVDLFDSDVQRPYESGIALRKADPRIRKWNREARIFAKKVFAADCDLSKAPVRKNAEGVNLLSENLNKCVYENAKAILLENKLLGVVGGDHSIPFGAIQAIAETEKSFGILHLDAHSDTRKAFEGFTYSHASIMYNVLEEIPQVSSLVQVGIRDFCEEEIEYVKANSKRVALFLDADLSRRKFEGMAWSNQCADIISRLPDRVWISFDIDGFDPKLCPGTGTPVPGGLEFQQANYLFRCLVKSKRKIIGFDLNEVSGNSEWDANVGARTLYKLCAWTLASQGKRVVR